MSKIIIGRKEEKTLLEDALLSPRSELIALYGRRRIGKTYLIREFYSKQIIFSFTGLKNGSRAFQIENFLIQLNESTDSIKNQKPKNWLQAFEILKIFLNTVRKSQKKKVIFIDEFPWVDSNKSGFLTAFENFWNSYCTTRDDLIVVICGSAASYMIKKIIRNRDGLHNRITRKIKLKPFNLNEVRDFLKYRGINLPEIEIIKIYMSLGGIAEYLEHLRPGDSAVTAIERICLQKGSLLEFEFDEVFKSLFEQSSYHELIINLLSKGPKKGMLRNEILEKQNLSSGGQFTKSMDELIESGFVEKYNSYIKNKKVTLFRIIDEFCLFHLQFMEKYKGNSWKQIFQKKEYEVWCGYAFEMICFKHIESIKKFIRCDQISSNNYSWNNSKAQIDLIIDRDDNIINLFEIKFYNDTFTIDENYSKKLRTKESEFKNSTKTKKGIYISMLTTYGITGKHSIGLVSLNLTCECLFA